MKTGLKPMMLMMMAILLALPVTAMNAYAGKKETTYYAIGGGVAALAVAVYMGASGKTAGKIGKKTREAIEKLGGGYVAGQENLPLTKHLNRLNAIEFVGPESHGLASQYDNSGVTYSLFEW